MHVQLMAGRIYAKEVGAVAIVLGLVHGGPKENSVTEALEAYAGIFAEGICGGNVGPTALTGDGVR